MIRSHIVPEYYLKQFTTNMSGRQYGGLWVYERGKLIRQGTEHSEGAERGYFAYQVDDDTFDESLESFSQQVETRVDDILKYISYETAVLTTKSWQDLCVYIALLFARTTPRRDFATKHWAKLSEDFQSAVDDEVFAQKLAAYYGHSAGLQSAPLN